MAEEVNNPYFVNFTNFKSLEKLKKSTLDLYLRYCGIEQCEPKHSYEGPRPDFWLHVVIAGHGFLQAENKTHQMGPNATFLIYPDQPVYYEADEKDPWTYAWVAFNGIKASLAMEYAGFTRANPTGLIKDPEPFRYAVWQMLQTRQMTLSNEFLREGFLFYFIGTLMDDLHDTKQHHGIYDYSYQVYVEHATQFIELNCQRDIKISEVAELIGVSRSYLTRCFKSILGVSPKQYLLSYRMQKAATLLTETDMPIKAIVEKVGYTDPMTFSKAFRKYHGQSPRFFREAGQEMPVLNEEDRDQS